MPKKDSRFDRVISMGKKAGNWMSEDAKPFKRVDSKMESYMQSKANKAMSEGKETKAKVYAAAEGVRKAVTPTTKGEVAGIWAGGAMKAASKVAGKLSKASKIKKINDSTYKSIEKGERAAREAKNIKSYSQKNIGYRTTTIKDGKVTDKGIGKMKLNFRNQEAVKKLRHEDSVNSTLAEDLRVTGSKSDKEKWLSAEEFTSRGKPIGKKIGDQGFQGHNPNSKRAKEIEKTPKYRHEREVREIYGKDGLKKKFDAPSIVKTSHPSKDKGMEWNPQDKSKVESMRDRDNTRSKLKRMAKVYQKATRDPEAKKEIKLIKRVNKFKGRNYTKE